MVNVVPREVPRPKPLGPAAPRVFASPVFLPNNLLASEPPALGQTRPPAVTVYSVHRALFTVCVQCSSGSCRGCSNCPPIAGAG